MDPHLPALQADAGYSEEGEEQGGQLMDPHRLPEEDPREEGHPGGSGIEQHGRHRSAPRLHRELEGRIEQRHPDGAEAQHDREIPPGYSNPADQEGMGSEQETPENRAPEGDLQGRQPMGKGQPAHRADQPPQEGCSQHIEIADHEHLCGFEG